mmetsp:Transcript_91712/g.294813  ORF Transcript_91712/g.294813 Transcript_91712/m.294813 type:complete len:226 (+) Transcript_91712:198-875(+)
MCVKQLDIVEFGRSGKRRFQDCLKRIHVSDSSAVLKRQQLWAALHFKDSVSVCACLPIYHVTDALFEDVSHHRSCLHVASVKGPSFLGVRRCSFDDLDSTRSAEALHAPLQGRDQLRVGFTKFEILATGEVNIERLALRDPVQKRVFFGQCVSGVRQEVAVQRAGAAKAEELQRVAQHSARQKGLEASRGDLLPRTQQGQRVLHPVQCVCLVCIREGYVPARGPL